MGPHIIVRLEVCQSDEILSFTTNMSLAQFNTFRRILISEVPTVAIDLIEIVENDSILCDEILNHRLSLIQLNYSKHDTLLRKDTCKCEVACEKCSFMIAFAGRTGGWLLSNDISPLMMKGIPVVYLANTHMIKFNAICTRGIARWHSKWSLGVRVELKVLNNQWLSVTIHNSGTYSFDYILHEAFTILQSKLDVIVKVV